MNLRKLKEEARESAWSRGHESLSVFTTTKNGRIAVATCDCGDWGIVDSKPAPNGIDIGGPAVALHCLITLRKRSAA